MTILDRLNINPWNYVGVSAGPPGKICLPFSRTFDEDFDVSVVVASRA
jgi:hypothetical protein